MAVVAAAPQGKKESETAAAPEIVVVSQADVRNLDGSSQWRSV
jgi:hypothetical protein